jgi:hypothetical protein
MADYTKNVVSLITLLLFMAGTVMTGIGIFRTNEMSEKTLDESFIIPAQVLNGLTVMFLLYLTSTSPFSPSYKLLIIILLVGGMILEIYLTSYADREAESIAAYVFIALNFIIRAFFLIDLIQGEWVKPFTSSVKPVQAVVKASVVKPVEQAMKEVTQPSAPAPKPESEAPKKAKSELISKWDKLKDMLQSKPEKLDNESKNDAWKTVIRPAEDSGRTDIKEVLKEAVGKLKDGEGNPIPLNSVDAIGGKRRS